MKIPAIDEFPESFETSVIDRALDRNQSETGGLVGLLVIK